MTLDLVPDLIYSALGFVLGWIAGRIGRDMAHHEPKPGWWPSVRTGLGILILLMTTYTMVTGVLAASHDRRVAACQAEINLRTQQALAERSDAARVERASQRNLLLTIEPGTTPQRRSQAIRDYVESLDEADRQRDLAPYPTPTECG